MNKPKNQPGSTSWREILTLSGWAIALGVAVVSSSGCSNNPTAATPATLGDCREGPIEATGRGARTAGQGAETAASGVKQTVKAAGGFLADGTDGAAEEWNEGKEETRAEAREGRAETREAANRPACP
jgi:hypothetical protein